MTETNKACEMKLIQGDCLEKIKDIPDGLVDMVLTDPPYGTTKCKWDNVIPFEPMWAQLKRVTKKNGAICLFGSQPFTSALVMSNPKMFKYEWIWDKVRGVGFQIAKYRPMIKHENIAVFCAGKITYYPIMVKRDKEKKSKCYTSSDSNPLKYNDGIQRVYSEKHPTSILTISNASQKNKTHPTQKPVSLMEYLIKTYTREGESVLDFTMGSGTTGVACKNLGRSFIGIELDEGYFNIAKHRIENTEDRTP